MSQHPAPGASAPSADPGDIPTGNTFDKYGSTNPVVKRLMAGFEGTLEQLFSRADPGSILDIGCGEAVLTRQWAARLATPSGSPSSAAGPGGRVVGVDLDDPKLRAHWDTVSAPNLELKPLDVTGGLPYAANEFELVCATEVLEHVPGPERVVAEMARVAGRHLLVSVPHEPLWRMLNVARGAYISDLGNTPGHINHWTKRAFVAMLARHGRVVEARSPFPWTMLLVDVS